VSTPTTELRKEGEKIAETMAVVLEEVLAKNGKETDDVWEMVTIAWGTLHGLVSLAMAGRIPAGEETERLVDRAVRDHLNAWLND
jgi:hypothetical protein